MSALLRDKWLLLVNAIGAIAYLWASSSTWIEPELRGDASVAREGDAVVWFGSAFPILLLITIGDLVWLGLQVMHDAKIKAGRGAWWPVLAVLAGGWVIVHVIDAHFIG